MLVIGDQYRLIQNLVVIFHSYINEKIIIVFLDSMRRNLISVRCSRNDSRETPGTQGFNR